MSTAKQAHVIRMTVGGQHPAGRLQDDAAEPAPLQTGSRQGIRDQSTKALGSYGGWGSDGASRIAGTGIQPVTQHTPTVPMKEGSLTHSQDNHDNHEDNASDRPCEAVARFDFPDLRIPVEVLLRGDQPVAITPTSAPALASTSRPRSLLKPQKSAPNFYTPRALAKHWGVHVDKVLRFIHAGDLPAFNAASRQSKLPRYRISVDAVREFEASHAACPAGRQRTAPARRKKRSGTAAVHRYF